MKEDIQSMEEDLNMRLIKEQKFRKTTAKKLKKHFNAYMKTRGHQGTQLSALQPLRHCQLAPFIRKTILVLCCIATVSNVILAFTKLVCDGSQGGH